MKPHLEEAWRLLRLAERDIKAFEVLKKAPDVHLSITYFHAQQAVEKSLKAVLFLQQIEFERTHDLVKLARLLANHGLTLPVTENQLRRLNPFAVAFRYDDLEITLASIWRAWLPRCATGRRNRSAQRQNARKAMARTTIGTRRGSDAAGGRTGTSS